MNIEKAQMKMGTAHEIGCRLDDSRESYLKEVSHWEGANAASLQVARGIEDLAKHVDKDIDEGQYDLEMGARIKKYLTRAATVANSVAAQAGQQSLLARGKVQAMEASLVLVRKLHDEEQKRVEAFEKAVASGQIRIESDGTQQAVIPVNIPGVRPGMSIKEQRLAEDAAQTQVETPPALPEKKRGGRGKRATNA